ncbi:MAG: PH domain-containing protein [Bacillota bacterium]
MVMREWFRLAPLDRKARNHSWFALVADILTFFPAWVLTFLYAPRGYRLSAKGVVIKALLCSETIPAGGIVAVEVVEGVKPGAALKANWPFGYTDLWSLEDGSEAKVYATRWDRMVRIRTSGGLPYLLSPADPEAFAEAVKDVFAVEN